ncbi:ATP-binding protein [Bifidobacterium sp. ESL0682]|uniref:ATP-binding protein n=1 Tax=Bifidobacterium sp. ESL0682 TaxID=2983212 RepID=UPI0023F62B10|nr:ATP-binding protein [Bifidobacterium sp. ESL0682]WEV42596.1 ATP-binding protein [Bifidobacterium sp. ESL0682]
MMALFRKAYQQLLDWKNNSTSQACLVTGARQVGKTFIIEEFGQQEYGHFVHLDFIKQPQILDAFNTAKGSNELFMAISAFAGAEMVPGNTLIFIDEVQECDKIITAIKYLAQRKGYDFILSGSLLGVELKDVRSFPVGYLHLIDMFPLDFEEFCKANGVGNDVFESAKSALFNREPVNPIVHSRLMDLFHQYLIVGGMPQAINEFVHTQNLGQVNTLQNDILRLYRADITKYAQDDKLAIREVFDQMPAQLNSQSKRFNFSSIAPKGTYERYRDDFLWLVDAGVALPVRNVKEPRTPLKLAENRQYFKLFFNDVGLLAASCGMQVTRSIISDKLGVNYGSIYENVVAEELHVHGHELYYYRNKKYGELDFVIDTPISGAIPIEVKSGKDYKRHSALSNVMKAPNWDIDHAIVLCEDNLSAEDNIIYCPVYMVAFL